MKISLVEKMFEKCFSEEYLKEFGPVELIVGHNRQWVKNRFDNKGYIYIMPKFGEEIVDAYCVDIDENGDTDSWFAPFSLSSEEMEEAKNLYSFE